METLFIEGRYSGKISMSGLKTGRLPEKIGLFTTVQYLNYVPELKKKLESNGKKISLFKPKNAKYPGQILGCSIPEMPEYREVDAFLYIGDGAFHPTALSIKNKKKVFTFNPLSGKMGEVPMGHIDKIEKQKKAALARFHSSDNIGILVSTKPGQKNTASAEVLKRRYPKKKFFFLVFDTLDFTQLENFSFIECFVNTACPRISYDDFISFPKAVVDYHDLL